MESFKTCWDCEHVLIGQTRDHCSVYGEQIIEPRQAAYDCPAYERQR